MRILSWFIGFLLGVLCALLIGIANVSSHAQEYRKIVVENVTYNYIVYADVDPIAILIALHGQGGGTGPTFALTAQLHASSTPLVVAYPTGQVMKTVCTTGLVVTCKKYYGWNSEPKQRDARFITALATSLHHDYGGALPVWLVGFSAGGAMTYRAALEDSVVDCAVVVSGGLIRHSTTVVYNAPYLLAINGTADRIVPILGGISPFYPNPGIVLPSAQASTLFVNNHGGVATLVPVTNGVHAWDLGIGYPTSQHVLEFCGG